MNKSTVWRSPAFGIIPGKSIVRVSVQVPFDPETESPLVFTMRRYGTVTIRNSTPTQVTIENTLNKPVPYLLVIVPKTALMIPTMNWKDRLQLLARKLLKDKNL